MQPVHESTQPHSSANRKERKDRKNTETDREGDETGTLAHFSKQVLKYVAMIVFLFYHFKDNLAAPDSAE